MYFDRHEFSVKGRLKVDDEGDDEDLTGFKSSLSFFQHVCVGLICVCVLLSSIS
jgi:hypothetical protein